MLHEPLWDVKDKLSTVCKAYSFVKRGNAFFRVFGDGVFQVIKLRYERGFQHYELTIGLQSMYSDHPKQHFTSSGCIPRYYVFSLKGKQNAIVMETHNGITEFKLDSPEKQVDYLREYGIDWLNTISTQAQLVNSLCFLDEQINGGILWNDSEKLAPFLYCGDYSAAEHVLTAILDQHKSAYDANRSGFSDEEYRKYVEKGKKEDEVFEQLLDMIRRHNNASIQNYLLSNYARNTMYAKFCSTCHSRGNGLREP